MMFALRSNLPAQAELLTFLVISQLFTKHSTGHWMTAGDIVDSSIFWPSKGYHSNDVVRRSMLASRAAKLAQDIEGEGFITVNGAALLSMFDDKSRLDCSIRPVRDIYDVCVAHLSRTKWYE